VRLSLFTDLLRDLTLAPERQRGFIQSDLMGVEYRISQATVSRNLNWRGVKELL